MALCFSYDLNVDGVFQASVHKFESITCTAESHFHILNFRERRIRYKIVPHWCDLFLRRTRCNHLPIINCFNFWHEKRYGFTFQPKAYSWTMLISIRKIVQSLQFHRVLDVAFCMGSFVLAESKRTKLNKLEDASLKIICLTYWKWREPTSYLDKYEVSVMNGSWDIRRKQILHYWHQWNEHDLWVFNWSLWWVVQRMQSG